MTQEYVREYQAMRRLQMELSTMVGGELFRIFCGSCLVHDTDETHLKEEAERVFYGFHCTKRGRRKQQIARGTEQVSEYSKFLKEVMALLKAAGVSASSPPKSTSYYKDR